MWSIHFTHLVLLSFNTELSLHLHHSSLRGFPTILVYKGNKKISWQWTYFGFFILITHNDTLDLNVLLSHYISTYSPPRVTPLTHCELCVYFTYWQKSALCVICYHVTTVSFSRYSLTCGRHDSASTLKQTKIARRHIRVARGTFHGSLVTKLNGQPSHISNQPTATKKKVIWLPKQFGKLAQSTQPHILSRCFFAMSFG
jgi:hypothetical protein